MGGKAAAAEGMAAADAPPVRAELLSARSGARADLDGGEKM